MTGGESVNHLQQLNDEYYQEMDEDTKENDVYSNRDKLNKIRLR